MALCPVSKWYVWWLHKETRQIHAVIIVGYYPNLRWWEIEFVDGRRICEYGWNLFSKREDAIMAQQNLINKDKNASLFDTT